MRQLDPTFPDLDDHDLIYALSRAGFSVLVTGNHKMLNDPASSRGHPDERHRARR